MAALKQKAVLVTGGAGLIGSHLIDYLLKDGYWVTSVDNFITGKRGNIAHLARKKKFNLINADVALPTHKYLPLTKRGYQYIFHLASPASPCGYLENPITTYKVNSFGTHYLLEFAKKQKARFLFASTSEIYGDPKIHPQPESYWGNVNPVGVRACYDESKRFGEMVCKTHQRKYNLDIRIARIFNTYGPRNDPNDGRVIPNFITQALTNKPLTVYGKGLQTRSFCYVSDLVEGLLKFMFKPGLEGQIINLGNPQEFKVIDLANKIKVMTNSHSEIIFTQKPEDDPNRRRPNINKAKKLLDWDPKISLEEGLVPTIEYFKKTL